MLRPRFSGTKTFAILAAVVMSGWLTGCQCCSLGDKYAGLIDDVSDHEVELDCLYRPQLDLNRIGKPDWRCSRLNRALCGRACNETCYTAWPTVESGLPLEQPLADEFAMPPAEESAPYNPQPPTPPLPLPTLEP